MSLCPTCGRVYCDHEPEERGQTFEEMMRELTDEETAAWRSGDEDLKLRLARQNAHLPTQ